MMSLPIESPETDPGQHGLAFLSRATRVLLSSLDLETTLRQVAEVAVPTLGDFCACVATTSDGLIHRASFADVDLRQQVTLPDGGRYWPLPEAEDHPIVRALRGGEPVFVPIVTGAWLETVATSSDQLKYLMRLDPHSLIAVPLVANDQFLGALTACRTSASGRGYAPEDLSLATEFARRAAQAIANGRRFRDAEELRARAEAERAALQRRLDPLPVRNAAGRITSAFATGPEIPTYEEIERRQDRHLAFAAHDVKNAVTAVSLRAQLLRRRARGAGGPEIGPIVDDLATIEVGLMKIAAMIDDLVNAAGLPLGRPMKLDRRPIDLVALAWHAAAQYEQVGAVRCIRLEATEARIIGRWDATHLARLLDNLLGNALKYSPGGGEIDLRLSREKDAAGEWAVLAIHDPGLGIPPADLPHVFEPFYRAANVHLIAGTGIGLASVKESVEQHGGRVTVMSEEGRGSTFTIRLPLDPGSTEASQAGGCAAIV